MSNETVLDPRRQEILATLSDAIREVVGEDFDLDHPIEMETSFNADLELESIEFVALAEILQERYGSEVDFVGWISGKELDELIELRVGDLVDFIASCLS